MTDKKMNEEATKREIDIYDLQVEMMKEGLLDARLFTEARLRRGAYGQRYDNGLRHDGEQRQEIGYGSQKKGGTTAFDAPGMQRIKIPWGGLTADQLRVISDLAEEYSDGILHVTTRQDIQLHFVHIEDTPEMMRRLAEVGITTREACGNSVRNITACATAGVCQEEAFDVTGYAEALKEYLLGHPDVQGFGRKLKISFSGCTGSACGLAQMHDLGFIAKNRVRNGVLLRGFELWVGGGLGAVPHHAQLFSEFVPEDEVLPISLSICRVFSRLGERKNRGKARMKYLVAKLGIEEFRGEVEKERAKLPFDDRWVAFLSNLYADRDVPRLMPIDGLVHLGRLSPDFTAWRENNVRAQRQRGYVVVTVALPLGDLSSAQGRALSSLVDTYAGGLRTTVDQNLVLRFVRESDLVDLHDRLMRFGLAAPVAHTIEDITACPGTDTCKLGISSSRGLASELRMTLSGEAVHPDARGLTIKISGCFNSCGQHQLADIGFFGVSRKKDGRALPAFQVVVGGSWSDNGSTFGSGCVVVPSKRIPEAVRRMIDLFVKEREADESFSSFAIRQKKARFRTLLQDLAVLPGLQEEPQLYVDHRDTRSYSMADHGGGEGKGSVAERWQMWLLEGETLWAMAQDALEEGDPLRASQLADESMETSVRALLSAEMEEVPRLRGDVADALRRRLPEIRGGFDPFSLERMTEPNEETASARVSSAGHLVEVVHTHVGGAR